MPGLQADSWCVGSSEAEGRDVHNGGHAPQAGLALAAGLPAQVQQHVAACIVIH
jgi:hypothetical protein